MRTYVSVNVLVSSCIPNRLVTITGNRESICKAFEAIGVKIEQVGFDLLLGVGCDRKYIVGG